MIKSSSDSVQVVQAYVDKADILDRVLGVENSEYVGKAVAHFEKALDLDRRNTYVMLRLAEIALRRERMDVASRWLQALFSSGPSLSYQARAHVLAGILAAEAQKDSGAAEAHFKRAAVVSADLESDVAQLLEMLSVPGADIRGYWTLYEGAIEHLSSERKS